MSPLTQMFLARVSGSFIGGVLAGVALFWAYNRHQRKRRKQHLKEMIEFGWMEGNLDQMNGMPVNSVAIKATMKQLVAMKQLAQSGIGKDETLTAPMAQPGTWEHDVQNPGGDPDWNVVQTSNETVDNLLAEAQSARKEDHDAAKPHFRGVTQGPCRNCKRPMVEHDSWLLCPENDEQARANATAEPDDNILHIPKF
jgi:hypothetical protein